MIGPRRIAVVVVLVGAAFAQDRGVLGAALVGAASGQERSVGQDIPALIEQLGEEEARSAAAKRLVALGEPAAKALLRAVFDEGADSKTEALQVLGRMRDHAERIVAELVLLRDLPPEHWPAFLRAVADLGPYTRMEQAELLAPFGTNVQRALAEAGPEIGLEIYNETVRMSGRITVTSIRAHSEMQKLVSALDSRSADGRALAAELLAHRGSSAAAAFPELLEALLTKHPSATRFSRVVVSGRGLVSGGGRTRVSLDREIHRAAARAMVAIAPGDPGVVLAMAHQLTYAPDPEERMEAAMALGRLGEEAAVARTFLVNALQDPDPRVVREGITSLGILGDAAREAVPGLVDLSSHEDPQIAERAKAALRMIRDGKRGAYPEPPVLPWDYEDSGGRAKAPRAAEGRA